MNKFLDNKKLVDEFVRYISLKYIPQKYKLSAFQKEYLAKNLEYSCYAKAFIPCKNTIANEIGSSWRTVKRAEDRLSQLDMISITVVKTKYGLVNVPTVKKDFMLELIAVAKQKEEADKTKKLAEKIGRCGRIDILYSTETDHYILDEVGDFSANPLTKCHSNINNNISNYNNLIICKNLEEKDKLSTSSESIQKSLPHLRNDCVLFSTDGIILDDDLKEDSRSQMRQQITQPVDYTKESKSRISARGSDNGYFQNASFKKYTRIPDDFCIEKENFELVLAITKLNQNQIHTGVNVFYAWAKRENKTSCNWQKSCITWLKQYDPNRNVSRRTFTNKINNYHPSHKERVKLDPLPLSTPDSIERRESAIEQFRAVRLRLKRLGCRG